MAKYRNSFVRMCLSVLLLVQRLQQMQSPNQWLRAAVGCFFGQVVILRNQEYQNGESEAHVRRVVGA